MVSPMVNPNSTAAKNVKDRVELEKERAKRQGQQSVSGLTPLKSYLLAYNIVSAALWAHLLYIVISFLLTTRPGGPAATSWWTRLIASSPAARKWLSALPSPLAAVSNYLSGSYEYKNLGWWTKWTQTLAVLEVVHAALGWVRSPVGTTAAQVASRVYTVWGVVEAVPSTHSSPLFATMLLAWSLTEVIRYSYYATSLLSIKSGILDWLRYTTFIPLYPLGAGSEALISVSTLPSFAKFPLPAWFRALNPLKDIIVNLPGPLRNLVLHSKWGRMLLWNLAQTGSKAKAGLGRDWNAVDFARLIIVLSWPPGEPKSWDLVSYGTNNAYAAALYVLYTYMIKQRRRVLGKGKRVGSANKAN